MNAAVGMCGDLQATTAKCMQEVEDLECWEMSIKKFDRGSEWRQWDLHIHTPASFHWNGQRFTRDINSAENILLVDEMIHAFNNASPDVFALMDYWTFDGWFALKNRLKQQGAPKLTKIVFPGIELRLMAPMNARLNAHVIFSDQIPDQYLKDFKSKLKIELIDRPLSDDALIELARYVGADKLRVHGFTNLEQIQNDDDLALKAGSTIAEINCDSYKDAINNVPDGLGIGFMPFDTSDGISQVKWQQHYAYALGLFKNSPIFETRDLDTRDAFVGLKTESNSAWFNDFQRALNNTPRLAVSGSDAHQFIGVDGDNDKRGYGNFPSNKATWIKADPTYLGLLQAIKEPEKRSIIGEKPQKLKEIEENRTYFIDQIEVSRKTDSTLSEEWLNGTSIKLNHDLVAIIGNKGNGKSALADVIALLGNSRQKTHFSFLKKDRFRGKSGEPARQFFGNLTWLDGSQQERNLSEDPPEDAVELIRYIPQGHFEELCNDHVSGKSNAFENELRAVIFDHASKSIRLGALDFDQLIEQQESIFRDRLIEYRKELKRINIEIETIEDQSRPIVKNSLKELLLQKEKQLVELKEIKPEILAKPSDQLSVEQLKAANDIDENAKKIGEIESQITVVTESISLLAKKQKSAQSIRDRVRLLQRQFDTFKEETLDDFRHLDIKSDDIVNLNLNFLVMEKIESSIPDKNVSLLINYDTLNEQKIKLLSEQTTLKEKLNEPQLKYQQSVLANQEWEIKLQAFNGSADSPDTLIGIQTRLSQLEQLPIQLREKKKARKVLVGEIFDELDSQRKSREELFKPVQELIQSNKLIRDDYKLQFQATLGGSSEALASELFNLIKQNSGEFRGEDESYQTIRKLSEQYQLNNKYEVIQFVEALDEKIHIAATGGAANLVGIDSILRKDRTSSAVYDLLYGLSYLEPRYSLLFQDAQIEQLSPGQRGALLLIFYLLVDKGKNPIILDQPEENLDNETVFNLLVPVLSEAKKKRQIIMVTHNPNLAVVCDAEQIIYSAFERKNASKITYSSGSIENPTINEHVVNVLEGTKPAFDNRRIKYH